MAPIHDGCIPREAPAGVGRAAGIRALFHVAADYRLWARRPQDIVQTNVEGTRALMEAALRAGVVRIVYTSSVATLKSRPDGTSSRGISAAYLRRWHEFRPECVGGPASC